jgi:hypothetical protein
LLSDSQPANVVAIHLYRYQVIPGNSPPDEWIIGARK